MTARANALVDAGQPAEATVEPPLRIGVLLASLAAGGLERTMVGLADGLARRGHDVTLLVCKRAGRLADALPPALRVVELAESGAFAARFGALRQDPLAISALLRPVLASAKPPMPFSRIPALATWLRTTDADALVSSMPQENLAAILARRKAQARCRIVVTEHNTLSHVLARARAAEHRHLGPLIARLYQEADAIVAVSAGVADDLAATVGLPRGRIDVLYNPVLPDDVAERAKAPVPHPWLEPGGPPVVLGLGRLEPQKDFATLVRAFARVRRDRTVRLLIVGAADKPADTPSRTAALRTLAVELGVAGDVDLPGWTDNPFAWQSRAAVFALSSRHEGFGNVLVEALACGCPVVSTDCPSGPAEILGGGRYGRLVPVGDDVAMARAIGATLDERPDPEPLRARAATFSATRGVERYEALLFRLVGPADAAELPPGGRGGRTS